MAIIELDAARCTGCGLCEAFCPVNVFEMRETDAGERPIAVRPEDCWGCDTCVGQCPQGALHVVVQAGEGPDGIPGTGSDSGASATAAASATTAANAATTTATAATIGEPLRELTADERAAYAEWSEKLQSILKLRWSPVAITLVPVGTQLPDAPRPHDRLRYCQSLMAARRGATLLMPPQCHACPDGTAILGLTEMPAKLASGELYILFKKLASIEAAQQMVAERPHLPERSVAATLVAPLAKAEHPADVIALIAEPEQMMWMCMSASFFTGKRFEFHVSGYNAQCVETTLYPYTTGELNISLGCYGCRASSDVGDNLMFMGIPVARMPELIKGLERLGEKAITDSRNKIYLPPLA